MNKNTQFIGIWFVVEIRVIQNSKSKYKKLNNSRSISDDRYRIDIKIANKMKRNLNSLKKENKEKEKYLRKKSGKMEK